jgi:hypothetical protein
MAVPIWRLLLNAALRFATSRAWTVVSTAKPANGANIDATATSRSSKVRGWVA